MGTRSTIALEFADLTVQAVYCHWDGFRLQTLIDQGNLWSLGSELGQSHEFDKLFPMGTPEHDWCKFYGRDRGETGNWQANKYSSWDHYCATHDGEQYDYCLRRDGTWWVRMAADGVYLPLADLLTASA